MAKFSNHYECPCGHTWEDEWDCTCDDRCLMCDTSCSPSFSYDLNNPEEVNEMKYNTETVEEHAARMKRIRDKVTADIKAGRYKHGQIHPHIRGDYARETSGTETGRWPSKYIPEGLYEKSFTELYMGKFIEDMGKMMKRSERDDRRMITLDSLFSPSRRSIPMILMDECHHIRPETMWIRPEPKEKDWERKTFKSGPATTPSEAVRQKRREERKRKKGK